MSEETPSRIGSIFFGLFLFFFGLPFTLAPFMIIGDGVIDPDYLFESLFFIVFMIPFLMAGLFVQFMGLSMIRGALRGTVDPTSIPRGLPPGPDVLCITEHPDPKYLGTYIRQQEAINGRDWYRKEGKSHRLYYYAQNEGGSAGWSLDDRADSGSKDWFEGGWLPYEGFKIPIGRKNWQGEVWVSIEESKLTEEDNSEKWWTEDYDSNESTNSIEESEIVSSSQYSISPIPLDSEIPKGPKYREIFTNIFGFLFFIFIILGLIPDDSNDFSYYSYNDEDMPDKWCDNTDHYPVTVPITLENELAGSEEYGLIAMENRNEYTDSRLELVINGGICTYQYRVADSWGFEFTFRLDNATNIDGFSILVMDHPLGLTSGYSGIGIETSTDNGTNWEGQYFSPYMFGDYERDALFEDPHENFSFNEWNRHKFNKTVSNVTHVRILTGSADQAEDASVSFSALRVDAEGDYDYPNYLLCSGAWDGRFVNSSSDMKEWNVAGQLRYGILEC